MSITQGLPDSQDIFLYDLWVHIRFRPEGPEYLILRYEAIRVLDQVAEYIESLRGQRHTIFAVPQAVVNDVEAKGMELFHGAGPARFSRQEAVSESLRH